MSPEIDDLWIVDVVPEHGGGRIDAEDPAVEAAAQVQDKRIGMRGKELAGRAVEVLRPHGH
jgi:hypothetical protein